MYKEMTYFFEQSHISSPRKLCGVSATNRLLTFLIPEVDEQPCPKEE